MLAGHWKAGGVLKKYKKWKGVRNRQAGCDNKGNSKRQEGCLWQVEQPGGTGLKEGHFNQVV